MTADTLPEALGRYRPLRILGQGAAGIVYLAQDPVLDRRVTVKVIRTDGLDAETRDDYLERFKVEAKAAGRCSHPGIVAIHDYAEANGAPFIVMEYVEGPTLHHAVHDPSLRPTLDPIGITLQILDALEAAHRLHITHRDIKPANILMTRDGRTKIADFGIARLDHVMLTQYVAMIGTPSYMAPEQAGGQPIDHRADLFATGAILFEMLAGKPPFQGSTLAETLANLLGPAPASLAAIPPALAPVLARALAKAPDARFQSAGGFAAALREVAAGRAGNDATIVAVPRPGPRAESLTGSTAAARWGAGFLKTLEDLLAVHLGPIATVLVRNAASRASRPEEIYDSLASALTKPADRAEFLRRAAALRPSGEATQHAAPIAAAPPPPPAAPTMRPTLSPAVLQAAETALAHYMGPIAKLLVRRAADQAGSIDDFRDRLIANLAKPDEAAALRRKLAQDLDRL